MFDRENYNVSTTEELPQLTFMSNLAMNELAPQHNDNTMQYQDYHPELERWAIFRSLPAIINYDKQLGDLLKNYHLGQITVPKYTEIINPPTLLSYFLTLPEWARKNSIVTNCFYAMEYH